ncbi:uncharacterized protein LOC112468779 isoform X2 [Temnothorax curvispinosus]|uniref:Uncharacterized protein LOC112468779 isoform X2 n=1 Tax=Temnothorax curvispinosus TaxID=300111 RepID=A0A6J1RHS4_9HYME|nr:uncharacterized protein LOC112468779 isoform X2 [Temnothorax curvispinosus]
MLEIKCTNKSTNCTPRNNRGCREANDKSRRYEEEWIMLCLLMNIRSPGYYEFLRKNNVLPLPCHRTIRSYFSLVDMKCGFDEEFAKLLAKHFETKTILQRHGVLLLDEINLRKSVAVCSKNLTYVGLTDFGNDGPQSTNLKIKQHMVSFSCFSLLLIHTQPNAVFASKNPVKSDELAKLVIKAIVYLERTGAKIHGVIADGASTNAKMWSLLGVSGSMEDTKTWFTHPVDDDRKVFVFSDAPHVIKNVRNRLYNKKKLRVKLSNNYICWDYIAALFNLDIQHAGNARACPKLTQRHVVLNSTLKMRVRLATQFLETLWYKGYIFIYAIIRKDL